MASFDSLTTGAGEGFSESEVRMVQPPLRRKMACKNRLLTEAVSPYMVVRWG